MSSNLKFQIAGHDLALMATPVKGQENKFWHCFRKANEKPTMFGTKIPKLAETLPTSVTIDGETIVLTKGMTPDTKKDKYGKETKVEPRPKVSASGTFHPPTIGEERTYAISISETTDGSWWNVKVSVNRGRGSVSPEQRREKRKADADEARSDLRGFMGLTA